MAGTLTISTLSDGTNSTSSTNCIQGSAKAWVNYKGTATRGINASYNVSSVTFNSTGNYTVNFTNAMSDANYATHVTATYVSGSWGLLVSGGTYTASAVQVGNAGTGAFVLTNLLC